MPWREIFDSDPDFDFDLLPSAQLLTPIGYLLSGILPAPDG